MKSSRIFVGIITVLMSFTIIYGSDLSDVEDRKISENFGEQIFEQFSSEDAVDKIWGAINNDSVRVGIQILYKSQFANWNVTHVAPRKMDGIRLRSVNNTVASVDIIDGGIGYDFATFTITGRSNHIHVIVDAFENYTSSLITTTTTTPVPDVIFKEWGTINYASKEFNEQWKFVQWNNPGEISQVTGRVNATKSIDGLRLTSHNNTVSEADILEGGIGFNYFTFKVIGNREFIDFSFNAFENGTYLETREVVYGIIDNNTKLDEKRFHNRSEPGMYATGNGSFSTSGTILGMRLTYLNYTDGRYEIIDGGLNKSSVKFEFRGPTPGESYDFNIEIFGNNAITIKLSIVLISVLIILVALFD